MYTDTIADLLTRLRNASSVGKDQVKVPYSKIKKSLLDVMQAKRFINGYTIDTPEAVKKNLIIELNPERGPLQIKRISKPGQRIYVKATELKKSFGGLGSIIISTPKGVITNEEAKKANIGGELICEIF